jgi:mono/diheme cytochrome c family protein
MPIRLRALGFGLMACTLFAVVAVGAASRPDEVAAQPAAKSPADEFGKTVVPFLNKYCNNCHSADNNSGGITLDVFESAAHAKKDRKTWESVERVLLAGDMPPKKKKQPEAGERTAVVTYLSGTLLKVSCVGPKDPGRVTMRRLNRAEYNNTIRDLCGVTDFQPANDFPSDDVGYGFDNIGDVLSVQPILIEKYLTAAEQILNRALPKPESIPQSKQTYRPQNILVAPRGAKFKENNKDVIVFSSEGSAFLEKVNFPVDAEYAIRVKAWGSKVGKDPAKMTVRIDGKDAKTFDVTAPEDKPQVYEVRTRVTAGEKRLAAFFTNPFEDTAAKQHRNLGVQTLEMEGPLGGAPKPQPPSVKKIMAARPATDGTKDKSASAEKVLTDFVRRAYRRPVKADEVQRLMKLYRLAAENGEPFEQAIKLPLKAVLVSPHFLFRVEDDPKAPDQSRTISDHELATRLSYFLWSSMPDDELFQLADKGELRKPGVLKAQVARMLKDTKSQSLMSDFAGQWLMLRSVWGVTPDTAIYPTWDDRLKAAMVRETEMYFDHVVKNDRKVTEFLDSNYTFLNERLAKHYGIKGVSGNDFRQVTLPDGRRGGVLTHASVLTVTSNPTRTSPVKRGKWVLENILASPPPPPPPNVPELEKTELKGTLRQQMEQHRANPSCASCHDKMDAIGFGLENFDGIGAWREDEKKVKIDASGVLPGGAKFDGPAELRKILLGKADLFRRCLAEKLTTFALGRGLEYYDKCVLDDLVAKLKAGDDRFSALVVAIVESEPFQQRKGKRSD